MRLPHIFEADEVQLVEPLFSDLCYTEMDELLLRVTGDKSRILIDEDERVLSMAAESPDGLLYASCFHLRTPSDMLITRFEELDGDVYQCERAAFEDAVREYYADRLLGSTAPSPNDLNPGRVAITRDLIQNAIGSEKQISCLDCCCGSGIGTLVMRDLGLNPLSYDNDPALLALGLAERRLRAERTMWIDGRMLDQYLTSPVDIAFGFMLGEIQPFNQDLWADIIGAASAVSDRMLLTVGTEEEAGIIREWLSDAGLLCEIRENDRDPIYDRWVISA